LVGFVDVHRDPREDARENIYSRSGTQRAIEKGLTKRSTRWREDPGSQL
jgi:hypothetical protein